MAQAAAREEELVQRRPLRTPEDEGGGGAAPSAIEQLPPHSYHTVKKWDGTWERVRLFDLNGPPGVVFRWLNPRNPSKARRRLGHIYWKALKRFVMSFNLLFFGITFLTIGLACFGTCDDTGRAWAFLVIGSLVFIPGIYSFIILFLYVRGAHGFTWKLLPEPG
eukprot:TRINITY_DN40559_c1_g1_i1.p3 TRINITY_DN40559_c1_g1~~TRINITY_DN40559_c1_g1_i1.p3  ORF type:complete len:191 (+),score=61.91 TRINITY_DN40559_c1_g1_i1:82-573(+)